jgi:hypothetical protein
MAQVEGSGTASLKSPLTEEWNELSDIGLPLTPIGDGVTLAKDKSSPACPVVCVAERKPRMNAPHDYIEHLKHEIANLTTVLEPLESGRAEGKPAPRRSLDRYDRV